LGSPVLYIFIYKYKFGGFMQTISVLLDEMKEYIQHSAVEAADYLSKKDIRLSPFEGSYIEFDKDFCASIYRDLITELIIDNRSALFKYGMFALVVAMRTDEDLAFALQLGVCFSDPSAETREDGDQSLPRIPQKD